MWNRREISASLYYDQSHDLHLHPYCDERFCHLSFAASPPGLVRATLAPAGGLTVSIGRAQASDLQKLGLSAESQSLPDFKTPKQTPRVRERSRRLPAQRGVALAPGRVCSTKKQAVACPCRLDSTPSARTCAPNRKV
jgi:hypothetical protein